MIRNRLLFLITCSVLFSTGVQSWARPAYDESIDSTRKFSLFGGPSREGPEAQWERVETFVSHNRLRPAIRHARHLVEAWPDHPLAVKAQRLRADLHFAREEYVKAFQAYQGLVDHYIGNFDYDEVLRQQLESARRTEHKEYSAFLGLGSFTQPLEAIPLYRQLLTNAPYIAEAPKILFDMGEIYFRKRQFMDSIQEYRLMEQRYPNSPFAEKAALRLSEAYARIAKRNPTDIRPREGEYSSLSQFLLRYPQSEHIEEVRERRKVSYDKLAKIRFDQAQFYEHVMNRPEAAIVGYQSLLKQFPDSEWTVEARERILELRSKEN
jgi:tetratricopeptide (TPR) repeat protein